MSNESTPEKTNQHPSLILAMPGVGRYSSQLIAWAAPMKLAAYARLRAVEVPPNEDAQADGYIVEQMGRPKNMEGFTGNVIWMNKEYFVHHFNVHHTYRSDDRVQRMYGEMEELDGRINKLELFMKSEKFGTLPPAEQEDLRMQLRAMQDYIWFLSRRVRRLGENNVNA